jgi:hypothetical protein
MIKLHYLMLTLVLSLMIGTSAVYGQNGYAHAVNKISQNATHELGTAYEIGNYSNISIASWPYGNISVYFDRYDDDYNLLWSAYWPSWGTVGGDGTYSSPSGQVSSSDEGWWTMTWGVNGVPLSPSNFSETYFYKAPQLPTFHVNYNYSGTNGPSWHGSWPYNPVLYNDDDTQMAFFVEYGMYGWSSSLSYKIYLAWSQFPSYYMISASDGSLGGNGLVADAEWDHYEESCTGACSGIWLYDAIENAEIVLDLNELTNAYYSLTQANPELDPYEFLMDVIGHEIGHTIGLVDINLSTANGICSEVQSIMYNRSPMVLCGLNYPTSLDIDLLSSLYASRNWCEIPTDICSE